MRSFVEATFDFLEAVDELGCLGLGEPADFGFVFFADGFGEDVFGEHAGFDELGSERVELLALSFGEVVDDWPGRGFCMVDWGSGFGDFEGGAWRVRHFFGGCGVEAGECDDEAEWLS